MYPKNNASPPIIAVGQVILIADGSVVTADASARVKIGTGGWGASGGTLACDTTSGCWTYVPSQAETNAESFLVAVYKASCIGCQVTVVTTASATAGKAYVSNVDNDAITAEAIAAGAIDAATFAADVAALVLGYIVDDATKIDASALNTATGTSIPAIKAKTDNLPTDPADESAVEAAITAATSGLATAINLATVAGYLDTEIAAILADTDELQKAITDGGRTDLLIDAIKAKTDLMLDAAAVANAVWDATQSAHVSAGTFGLYLDGKVSEAGGGTLTAAEIADAVWDELATGHIDTGKAGAQLWTVINTLSSGSAINVTTTTTIIETE